MYNLIRHIELVKPFNYFQNLGKNLAQEEPENFLEFSKYEIYIEDYLYWKKRFKYLSLMQNFLNEKIDIEEFSDNIFAFRREVEQELNDTYVKLAFESGSEKFQDFNPNLRVKG